MPDQDDTSFQDATAWRILARVSEEMREVERRFSGIDRRLLDSGEVDEIRVQLRLLKDGPKIRERLDGQKEEIEKHTKRIYVLELTGFNEEQRRDLLRALEEWEKFREEWLSRVKHSVESTEKTDDTIHGRRERTRTTLFNALIQIALISPFVIGLTVLIHLLTGQ